MENKEFVINVGPEGTFRKSGGYQTIPEDIDSLFEKYLLDKRKKISIFFHGGLINETQGLIIAQKMANGFNQAGNIPICFVWETGIMETLSANLSKISETKLFRKILKLLLKKTAEKIIIVDSFSKGAESSNLTYAEIEAELSKPVPFNDYKFEPSQNNSKSAATKPASNDFLLASVLEGELKREIESDPDFVAAIKSNIDTQQSSTLASKGIVSISTFIISIAKIAIRIVKRYREKREHGFYPTVVEEILRQLYIAELGAFLWNGMKLKAEDMWKPNDGRTDLDRFVGRYFLEQLIDFKIKNPEVQINLIGHSAGSITICHLLKTVASLRSKIKFENIIFLAPACRTELFFQTVIPNQELFKQFRCFTMCDEKECDDVLVRYFYTRSLLYLVSGALENEGEGYDEFILGLTRYTVNAENYKSFKLLTDTASFLNQDAKNRFILSQTASGAPDGLKTMSLKHGDFDDDPVTIESIKFIIH